MEFTEGEGSSPELPTGKGCGGTFQGKALEEVRRRKKEPAYFENGGQEVPRI